MNPTAPASPATPRVLVCVKADTLGDVVLFASALQALREALSATRIVLVIREAYADIGPLLAPGIELLTTTLDPFARGPESDAAELQRLRDSVAALKPAVVVAATSRRNWLEIALAAGSGASRRIALGRSEDEFFATQLRIQLGIEAATAFTEHVDVLAAEPDWQRNLRLADVVLGRQVARHQPRLVVDKVAQARAGAFLAQQRLVHRKYVVCAAAGFANVGLKTWAPDKFAAVARHLRERYGLPTLFVGHLSERNHLESVVASAGTGATLWLGESGSLPMLAALIADAALFVGNDTGAMHIAAAVGVATVAVFGGGTWPRFVPANPRSIAVVQPLPCFGCGWDCAFGDAPCIAGISVEDVTGAVDSLLSSREPAAGSALRSVEHLSAETREMMGKAAARYRESREGHLARQHKLEELTALDREKDIAIEEKEEEIHGLKAACEERLQEMFKLDARVREVQNQAAVLAADKALLEKTLRDLPSDEAKAAQALADQALHIRNIEAVLKIREHQMAELQATASNRQAGLHDLEQAKHYGRLLGEKEAVIGNLRRGCEERDAVIRRMSAESTSATSALAKLGTATAAWWRLKVQHPFSHWLFASIVERYWMQIGVLRHYSPRPLRWDDGLPSPKLPNASLPQIGIVTPSYGQEKFIERTIHSILDQHYPRLRYAVQDGGSKDRSAEIIARYADRLHHWESVRDKGQADAIGRGFAHVAGSLGPDDVMAWLNSDDLLGPGVLRFVAEYFARHPDVDVIYGHRIIIDDDDRDVGRWIMPRHDPATLEWIDYVPQETLFWRKRAWDLAGGIDPSFQFALDWDLLARFQQAHCRIVRVPYFLGAFRVHAEQKTTQAIHTTGAEEMKRVRTRFHGERQDDAESIERHARKARFWGAVTARLHEIGIRW